MKRNEIRTAYLMLHLAVLLFGFTAILGVLIDMSALHIVWWRVLITAISLLVFLKVRKSFRTLSRREMLTFLGIGGIVGLHWLTFYGAVKLSNASITLVCMATASLFTSIIEPLVTRTKFKKNDILVGLVIIPGMMLVVGDLNSTQLLGVVVGLTSAALAALFASLNKKHIHVTNSYSITFWEMTGAWLLLCLILPFAAKTGESWIVFPSGSDWGWLLVLALLCTTFAFILTLLVLRHLTAFASNLVINLEPVYGILLAMLILHEHKELSPQFYLGVIIIVGVVILYPWLQKRSKNISS